MIQTSLALVATLILALETPVLDGSSKWRRWHIITLTDRVVTAGAFLKHQDRWVFVVGPTKDGDRLGITRLGGHREPGETPWECVAREVLEEAAVHVLPLQPPATYWFQGGSESLTLEAGSWQGDGVAPLVAVTSGNRVTPLYLARTEERPTPSSETQGLLFLTPAEIERILTHSMTLQQHLDAGGRAVLRTGFPAALPLAPFYHIRLLNRLLSMHPELL